MVGPMIADGADIEAVSGQGGRLRTERDRFVALAFCWADILFELDAARNIVFAGGPVLSVLGRSPESLTGGPIDSLVAPSDQALLRQLLRVAEERGRIDGVRVRLEGAQGPTPPLSLAGYQLDDFKQHFFLAFRMSAANDEADTVFRARDAETGLYDQSAFPELAAKRIKRLQETGENVKVSMVSMGGFAKLRSRLDAATGRSLMDTVSACLRAHSADGDTVARIDQDRYGLVHDAGLDLKVFEKELESVTREVDPVGKGISVDAATISVEDGGIGEEDMAKSLLFVVNRICESHGGQYTLKSLSNNLPELMTQAVESVEAFKTVIAKSAFNLAFQPIVDVHTGGIHHYEALVRFGPASKGNSSPFRQITFAEEVGLIDRFDLEVAKKAIAWLAKWPRNTRRYRLAVNVSGHSVGSDFYVSSLHKLLRENPWVQGKLMFEITESSRMTDLDRANDFIQGLRKVGYPVCLDDFGAGAASFQYLSALEVDIVKLDGSAVRNTYSGAKGRAFLSSLAALCKSLGVETIAEMVEKRDVLAYVRKCGIDFAQGYLFGEPSTNIKDFDPLPRADLFRRR